MILEEIVKNDFLKLDKFQLEKLVHTPRYTRSDEDRAEVDELYFSLVKNGSEEDSDKQRFYKVLCALKPYLQEDGVARLSMEYAGSGDSMDFCEGELHVISLNPNNDPYPEDTSLEDITKSLNEKVREEAELGRKWSNIVDWFAYTVEDLFHSSGYEINDGGGGSATWNLGTNELSFHSYDVVTHEETDTNFSDVIHQEVYEDEK